MNNIGTSPTPKILWKHEWYITCHSLIFILGSSDMSTDKKRYVGLCSQLPQKAPEWGLTYDRVGVCSECAHALGPAWYLELAEAPARAEVLRQERGGGKAGTEHTISCQQLKMKIKLNTVYGHLQHNIVMSIIICFVSIFYFFTFKRVSI